MKALPFPTDDEIEETDVSAFLRQPTRALQEACHDEGVTSRQRGAALESCGYTMADTLGPWREGWFAEDDRIKKSKETGNDR